MLKGPFMTGLVAASCLAALAACERDPGKPEASGDALASCYRTVERAMLSIDYADELSASDRRLAMAGLEDAQNRVLVAWAKREGMPYSQQAIVERAANTRAFLDGVKAEASLGEQERLSERAEAASEPDAWRTKFDGALDCADRMAANGA